MARPLRIELAGAWYHVTGRGTERRRIFADDRDRRHWLELLGEASKMWRLAIHGYVLMDNHHHLIREKGGTSFGIGKGIGDGTWRCIGAGGTVACG